MSSMTGSDCLVSRLCDVKKLRRTHVVDMLILLSICWEVTLGAFSV